MNLRRRVENLEARLTGVEDCDMTRQLRAEQRWRDQFRNAQLHLLKAVWRRLDPQRAEEVAEDNMVEYWRALPAEVKAEVREASNERLKRALVRRERPGARP